jgi:chemotaxis protein MotB
MLHLFSEQFAVPVNRLAAAGYSDTVPVAANDSESGRARNRRVDIVILNQLGRSTDAKAGAENSRKNF